jgi:sugar phosphate permease
MSTPPLPPPPKPISLAKLATIFAVVFGLAFGLCTIGTMTDRSTNNYFIPAALIIEAICTICLIVIAIIVIIRALRGDY